MKIIVTFLFLMTCTIPLVAHDFIDEDFSGTFPPAGWTRSGANSGQNWIQNVSDEAGGTSPELHFFWNPATIGTQQLLTGLYDTSDFQDVYLDLRYMLDHYAYPGSYTVGIYGRQYPDPWTTIWSESPTTDISATEGHFAIDPVLLDGTQFQLKFQFGGDSNNINWWAIDDLHLYAETQVVSGTWTTGSTVTIDTDLLIPDGQTLNIEPGVTVEFAGQYDIVCEGTLNALGTEAQPIVFQPQTVGMNTGHVVVNGPYTMASAIFEYCNFEFLQSSSSGYGLDTYGGAVVLYHADTADFSHCIFGHNYAWSGGGAIYNVNTDSNYEYCVFEDNTGYSYGGAFLATESNLDFEYCLFEGNQAQMGGALNFDNNNIVYFMNCTFTGNNGALYDGDIASAPIASYLNNLYFEQCVAWNNDDQFLYVYPEGDTNVDFSYSNVENGEDAISDDVNVLDLSFCIDADPLWDAEYKPTWTNYPEVDATKSPIIDAGWHMNTPDPDGTLPDLGYSAYQQEQHVIGSVEGMWTWTAAGSPYLIGGPITIDDGDMLIIEPGVTVKYHGNWDITCEGTIEAIGTADNPIVFEPVTPGQTTGHLIVSGLYSTANATMEYCHFQNLMGPAVGTGITTSGGAVVLQYADTADFSHCLFSGNFAWSGGGAVYNNVSDTNFEYCVFENNTAYSYGGALYSQNSTLDIDHCLFNGNQAQMGGAINFYQNSTVWFDHCTFTQNDGSLYNGDIAAAPLSSQVIDLHFAQSVVWNSDSKFLYVSSEGETNVDFSWCNIEGGESAIHTNIYSMAFSHCIDADPLWDANFAPTWANYPAFDATRSPLIDGGNYTADPDPDNTVADIGYAHYDQGDHVIGDVYGTWTTANSPYRIGGPVTVPDGQFLFIEPGVEVIFCNQYGITVEGQMQAEGTASQPIEFAPLWVGMNNGRISIDEADGGWSTFSYCNFSNFKNPQQSENTYPYQGAVFYVYYSDNVSFSNCVFDSNQSMLDAGAGLCAYSTVNFDNCVFRNNTSGDRAGAVWNASSEVNFSYCLFAGNQAEMGGAYAISNQGSGTLTNCTFTGNVSTIYHSDLYAYAYDYDTIDLDISNCIWWNSEDRFIITTGNLGDVNLTMAYCSVSDQDYIYSGSNLTVDVSDILEADPLFVDPAGMDFTLQAGSPCIDAGNPTQFDPDFSIVDLGCYYYDQSDPAIEHVHDIPGDQGHQVQLLWKKSSRDWTWDNTASYSVWRLDDVVRSSENVFDNPAELLSASAETDDTLYWRLDDTYWAFIAQVPALLNQYYIYNAPTLADSSTTGTHMATFKVVHHRTEGYWTSESDSGYSVDNIAPDAVATLDIAQAGAQVELIWEEVTTGTHEGNSYPELNGVWYRVYGASTPVFECNDDTYLFTTQDTSSILDPGTAQKMFYRIIVSDQP